MNLDQRRSIPVRPSQFPFSPDPETTARRWAKDHNEEFESDPPREPAEELDT
jgi:hypothetical protein